MDKKLVFCLTVALVAVFGFTGLDAAANEAPDGPLTMSVEGQTRPLLVKFDHKTHKDYKCEECHHVYEPNNKGEYPKDKRGNYKKLPENHYKEGQEVKACKEGELALDLGSELLLLGFHDLTYHLYGIISGDLGSLA